MITIERLTTVLNERFGGLLAQAPYERPPRSSGGPPFPGRVTARELRSAVLYLDGLTDEWLGTHPDGARRSVTDRVVAYLNRLPAWSSPAAVTSACLPLALLSEATAADEWVRKWVRGIARVALPVVMHYAAASQPDTDVRHAIIRAAVLCHQADVSLDVVCKNAVRCLWTVAYVPSNVHASTEVVRVACYVAQAIRRALSRDRVGLPWATRYGYVAASVNVVRAASSADSVDERVDAMLGLFTSLLVAAQIGADPLTDEDVKTAVWKAVHKSLVP